ncbi:MAG: nicotinamide riboside transporter PnuC [Bacteroidota bacterium]|nr:nicotinamide riboside transporter PnuC [Bacteroidota bacterium]
MQDVFQQFFENLKNTSPLEYIAVIAGILSVWFSKKENILVYPVGLINTIIYIYLSFKFDLIGEASVNFYYTVVSMYGWYVWTRKDKQLKPVLHITFSNRNQLRNSILFFASLYIIIFVALTYLKQAFYPGVIPWADAFASATAFTGMWLMARKKVESWYWWIATNIASMPLYFVKGLVFTSMYYFVLLILAFFGLKEWKIKAGKNNLFYHIRKIET